ncbi:MAG: hypothetical protein FJZ79_08185 [Chlorobi bacterium]|nr:hypothetical protein [Chlorobiota bacterium]
MTLGALSGTIDVDVLNGSGAYGIGAGMAATGTNRNLVIGGDVSGTVTATAAGGNRAYGLYARQDLSIGGGVSGVVSATAGLSDAAGIYSLEGSVRGASSFSPLVVTGSVLATATGASAGILSWDAMNC